MKLLIFDSSSLITLAMNGLDVLLPELKKQFSGKFLITQEVKYETIDRPLTIKKFELSALRIKKLLDEKVLELPEAINISGAELKEKTKEILSQANAVFAAKNEPIHIIDAGEASCLALSFLALNKDLENAVVIDERTTRMLFENPDNLRRLFENKFHTKVSMLKINFPKVKFIRSAELAYLAYKKQLVNLKSSNVLDALLYAVKFKGCSISRQEIEEMKRL